MISRMGLVLSGAWIGGTLVLMLTMLAFFLGTDGITSAVSFALFWLLGLLGLPFSLSAWRDFRWLVQREAAK